MPQPRIVWNRQAFRQIRRLEATQDMLYDFAKVGAAAANEESGGGYVARSSERPTRSRAAVITATYRARRDNARNHTLVGKSIDAMRNSR